MQDTSLTLLIPAAYFSPVHHCAAGLGQHCWFAAGRFHKSLELALDAALNEIKRGVPPAGEAWAAGWWDDVSTCMCRIAGSHHCAARVIVAGLLQV